YGPGDAYTGGGNMPPAASGVGLGPAYSDLPLSTGSPQHPFDNASASIGGIDISGSSTGENIPLSDRYVSPTVSNTFYTDSSGNIVSSGRGPSVPTYPTPGGGSGGPTAPDWAQNAASGPTEFGGTGFGAYAQA